VSASQKPDATRVAGLFAWNRLGRKVKKGEKGKLTGLPMGRPSFSPVLPTLGVAPHVQGATMPSHAL
jgi:hypothetical protein